MQTTDVLIVPQIREEDRFARDQAALSDVQSGVVVHGDIRVERMREARHIVNACSPTGHNFSPARVFDVYYAVVRDNPPNPRACAWDPDERLRRAIVFSRLVRFTPTGYLYCARVERNDDGGVERIIPFPGPRAYGGSLTHPWLTRQEWENVGSLLGRWESSVAKDCSRFNEAVWHLEKAALEPYLAHRWVLIATAIEALVAAEWQQKGGGKGQRGVGRGQRFKDGLSKLAQEDDQTLTMAEAEQAWDRRSSVVHGAGLPPLPVRQGPPLDELYNKVESIVSTTLRRMIESDEFAKNFVDNNSVERWLQGDRAREE